MKPTKYNWHKLEEGDFVYVESYGRLIHDVPGYRAARSWFKHNKPHLKVVGSSRVEGYVELTIKSRSERG